MKTINTNLYEEDGGDDDKDNEDTSPKISENITNDMVNTMLSTLQGWISELDNEGMSYKSGLIQRSMDNLEKIKT